MSIEGAIRAHLTRHSKTALIIGDRAYYMQAPPNAPMPFVVYQDISAPREGHMTNASGIVRSTFQITGHARSLSVARELADEIRKSLDYKHEGTIGRAPHAETVQTVILENAFTEYEQPRQGQDWGSWRVVQEWHITYEEPLPTLAV